MKLALFTLLTLLYKNLVVRSEHDWIFRFQCYFIISRWNVLYIYFLLSIFRLLLSSRIRFNEVETTQVFSSRFSHACLKSNSRIGSLGQIVQPVFSCDLWSRNGGRNGGETGRLFPWKNTLAGRRTGSIAFRSLPGSGYRTCAVTAQKSRPGHQTDRKAITGYTSLIF